MALALSPDEIGGGRLVGFWSPVGGAGASSLACAAALSVGGGALADLHPASKVRSYMGITPSDCPVSVLDLVGVDAPEGVERAGVAHPGGVLVIPGVARMLDAAQLSSRLAARVAFFLKRRFAFSVCVLDDLWRTGWAVALACDTVVVVLRPERADLDAYADAADLLSRLGCVGRTRLLLNQAGVKGGLEDGEVRAAVSPDAVVRYSAAFRASCNRRRPDAGALGKEFARLIKEGGE